MRRLGSPFRYALQLALVYVAIAGAWIFFSSRLANWISLSKEDLVRLEIMKGFGFVVVTGTLLFFASAFMFRTLVNSARRLVDLQRRAVESERKAMNSLLTASLAHDIANSLALMRLSSDRMIRMDLNQQATEMLAKIAKGIDKLTDISSRLRNMSRNVLNPAPVLFAFSEAIEETIEMVKFHPSLGNVEVEFLPEENVMFCGYPVLVHQVVMNLVINAAEATGPRGKVEVRSRTVNRGVEIEVHDNGPGISEEIRERIFERFFTTKEKGTGLGLLSVRSCVEQHHGSFAVDKSPLGGALFRVMLADQSHLKAVPDADVPMAPVDSILT